MHRKTPTSEAKFKALVQRLAKEFRFNATLGSFRHRASLQRDRFPITIGFSKAGKNCVFVYLYVRTTSWDFEGERTDLHDALSVALACMLRILPSGVSCRIWDVGNPAVQVPDTEIYGRYLTFDQPSGSIFKLDEVGYSKLSDILKVLIAFGCLLPRMTEWVKIPPDENNFLLYDFKGTGIRRWASAAALAIKQKHDSEHMQYNLRKNPCWFYLRSLRPMISIFKNPALVSGLRVLSEVAKPWEMVRGVGGDLIVSNETKNYVADSCQKQTTKILRKLPGEQRDIVVRFIPLENYCVAIGSKHLIFLANNCGREQFEREREKLRPRHFKVSALLFPPSRIAWKATTNDCAFENLIMELLAREPGVRWVRKMGHTNEPEGGRDLIVEWDTPPVAGQIIPEGSPPTIRRRVIVQCKASKHSVGKSDVRDVHDLLKRHNATGFFVAASSYLTVGLIGHLEKLRYEAGFWSDWWTKSEIERRLLANEDIATKYPNLFKFVDQSEK
jgi:hypothetical protein